MIENQSLPEQIVSARKTLNLRQEKFAKHFGVTQATISRWEAGVQIPSGPAMLMLKAIIAKAKKKAGAQ